MPKITINDIAKKAGVSKTSVSYAFNDPSRLPKETVQRILEIAQEIRYVPNPVARSMTTGRTGALGILLPMSIPDIIPSPFLSEFLFGISEVCTEVGFSIMLVPPIMGSMEQAISNAAVDGFITLGVEENTEAMVMLQRRNVPFITVDSDPISGVPAVNIEDEAGARAVMDYVLKAGHRNLVIIAIKSETPCRYQEYIGTLRQRMNGYLSALENFDLELDGEQVRLLECESTISAGQEIFKHLWNSQKKPTAVVAMSDVVAIGLISAAKKHGLRIPHELSVVGFDDIPIASIISPSLTTVAQPIYGKGELAATLLIKNIEGEHRDAHHILPTKLIVRESVSPPAT
jgi:alanine racemase